jgi:outer membrane receptor protein involved in Fe transport
MHRSKPVLRAGAALWSLSLALLAASQAAAQDAEDATAAADNPIIVTGSRIQRDAGFNEPTPVTVINNELIENLGQVNVTEALRLIPQNSNFQSDSTAGVTAGANVGASFANLRGLNPYNGTRTLTLVNSRRFIPTSDGGAIDLNVIPSAMIERVETVTGGASAAYGSDAIAGVVNILLRTNFEGLEAQADYGQTFQGDGVSYHTSLIGGTSFAGGRGHVVGGIEYQHNEGIGDCSKVRDWCAESWDVFTNSSNVLPGGGMSGYNVPGSPGYGLPNFIIGPDSKQANNDPRGVVRDRAPAALAARNMRFNEAGTGVVPYNPGQFLNSFQFGSRQGGDGASTYDDSDLQTPLERWVGYLYAEYDLTDGIELQTELTYAQREASNTSYVVGPRSTFFVNNDNPYIPSDLRALLNGTNFSLGKDLDHILTSVNRAEAEVFRGLVGLSGALWGDWTWDAYYQYGHNFRHQDRTNNRVNSAFQFALEVVDEGQFRTGTPNGNIVCKELLRPNPNPISAGCLPMNLFGLNNADPAALAYVYRPVVEDFTYDQHVLSGAVQGTVWEGWGGGPIEAAAGVDWRSEGGDVTHGDIPFYNDYAFTFGLDYSGDITVLEGFGELNVPVFRDSFFGELLELNGAVRYTRNHAANNDTEEEKTSEAVSWKLTGVYDAGLGLRLRASRSRDIRAAGFRELFLRNVPTEPASTSGIVDNPWLAGSPPIGDDPVPILNGGSFALEPETADTTTAGIVFQPEFLPGLRVSLDWYQIKISDAVTTLTGQAIADFCNELSLFCDRITFAAADRQDITFLDARQVNLAKLELRGIDVELDYRMDLEEIASGAPGSVYLRILGNHQYDFISQADPNAPERDYAGQSGPVGDGGDFNPAPPWVWNAFVGYDIGGFNATVSYRRFTKGIYRIDRIGPEDDGYDPLLADSINTNRVEGASYFDLAMSYEVPFGDENSDRSIEVFGAITNLFDKDPPIAPGGGGGAGSNYPTNPVYFDTFGSRFRAGVRVRY